MSANTTDGYLGPGLVVRGRLSGQGALRVDGSFEGEVHVDGTLTIGAGAQVSAAVKVENLLVAGALRGNVTAAGLVHVLGTGQLEGDVRAPGIEMDDGGTLHGSIVMDFDAPESA